MVLAIPLASAPIDPGPPSVAVASTALWGEFSIEEARPALGSGRTGGWWEGESAEPGESRGE